MKKFLFLSHFSGCGGSAIGAKQAGFELVGAVEFDSKIAQLYKINLGSNIKVDDITNVNPSYFDIPSEAERLKNGQILVLQTSPPCQEFSEANQKKNQDSVRGIIIKETYSWYTKLKPEYVILENVEGYAKSKAYFDFENFLIFSGYSINKFCLNSADYGVAQTRVRFISIATKKGCVAPILHQTHEKNPNGQISLFAPVRQQWVSWHDAITDLIPTLKEVELSENQLRVIKHYQLAGAILDRCGENVLSNYSKFRRSEHPSITLTTETKLKVLLDTNNCPSTKYGNKIRYATNPSFTITTKDAPKIVESVLVALKLNTQSIARIQSFPDSYKWDNRITLSRKAIGNSVPPLVMQRICESIKLAVSFNAHVESSQYLALSNNP